MEKEDTAPRSLDIAKVWHDLANFPEGLSLWESLNKITKIDAGGLTVVASGTSHGKSTFGYNLILKFLEKYDGAVILWSGEMATMLICARLVSILADRGFLDVLWSFKSGLFTKEELEAIRKIEGWSNRLYIIDSLKQNVTNVDQLNNIIKLVTQKQKVTAVLIDYLQQLAPPGRRRYGTREQEVTAVAKCLHVIASEMEIPVIAFSQISRNNLQYKEKPRLTDLRESGGVEQYAQAVFGVWNSQMAGRREVKAMPVLPPGGWYWSENSSDTDSAVAYAEKRSGVLMEVSVLKNRLRGNIGKAVPLLFRPESGKIADFNSESEGKSGEGEAVDIKMLI